MKNITKIYTYQIKADKQNEYLQLQSKVLALYQKHVEVSILFLSDEENHNIKKEIVRFFNVTPKTLALLDEDKEIINAFLEFRNHLLDPSDQQIKEESFTEHSLSNAGRVNHIEIYCSQLENSKQFWSWFLDFLGYKVFQQWSEGISYKLAESYVVLVQVEAKFLHLNYHRKAAGLNHLAFYARDKDQVNQLATLLKQKNIPQLYPEKFPHAGGDNTYGVFFEDPERIKIELIVSI